MIYQASSYRKILFGLMLMLLSVAPAFSSEYVGSYCVDIESSASSSRILKLAVTAVGDGEYFSLSGSHLNTAKATIGSAVGTASLAGKNVLILTVNASSAEDTSMTSTLYQFSFDPSTLFGSFQSITQRSINGTFTPLDYKSGQAALVSCNAGLIDFSEAPDNPIPNKPTPNEPPPSEPPPNEPTPNDPYYNVYDYDKDFDPSPAFGGRDCNNNDRTISSREKEVCGDGIDNNCNGVKDEGCVTPVPEPKPEPKPEPEPGNSAAFKDNGNETITQTSNGLIWQETHYDPLTFGPTKIDWQGATNYCEGLTLGGASTWRLPTRTELEGLIDPSRIPTIDPAFSRIGSYRDTFWTGTKSYIENSAYAVDFGTGKVLTANKNEDDYVVRCVR